MDIVKNVGFWSGFSLAMIVTLVIGGFVKGYPQFGSLLLIALVIALFTGFFTQQAATKRVKERVKEGVKEGAAMLGKAAIKRRRRRSQ